MNKQERFLAAVNGDLVDKTPVTAWAHFLSDHLDSRTVADLHIQFMRAYDWDILKVMNDYRYPVPQGVLTLECNEQLKSYKRLNMTEPCFAMQLDCLRALRSTLGNETPILETVFEPYQQIVRNIGFDQLENLLSCQSAATLALESITETMCDYVRAAASIGVDGIFLSINGAIPEHMARGVTSEQHIFFQKPHALKLLKAAQGMTRILHVHGNNLQMDRIKEYPYEVLSLSDRLPGNPTLSELREMTDKCIMGGVDETRIHERSLPNMAREIDDAVAQAGQTKFILAPGCTIPSFTSKRNLYYLRQYSEKVTLQ